MTSDEIQPYEYKVLEVGADGPPGLSKTSEIPERGLNEMGVNGWELVEQINMENGATQALIFKRPIGPERKEELENELDSAPSDTFVGKMKDRLGHDREDW